MQQSLRSSGIRYGLAVLSVALTLLLVWLIPPLDETPFFFFTTAVIVSAWFGGLRPGLLATVLSVGVVDFFFLHPTWSFRTGLTELFQLFVFGLLAVLISSLNGQRLRALEALRQAEVRLQQQVNERTAELRQSNETLQREIAERQKIEAQYRNVVESQTEMICRYLPDTTLTFVNEAYCRYFQQPREALLGTKFLSLVPAAAREAVQQQVTSLLQHPCIQQLEHEVTLPDGSIGWQHWIDSPIFDAAGHVLEFQSVGRDITELKQAERALQEQQKRLRLALDAAELGAWEWDFTTDQALEDARAQGLINAGAKGLAGFLACVHPDDREFVRQRLMTAVETKTDYHAVYRILTPEGGFRWVEDQARVMTDEINDTPKLLGVVQDITERKQAEASQDLLVSIVESSPDAILSYDLTGHCIAWNKGAEELFGYTVEEAIGSQVFQVVPPERQAEVEEKLKRIRQGDAIQNFETVRMRKDGSLVDVSLTASPVRNVRGEVIATAAIVRDITERKILEAQFLQAQRLESLGTLAGGIAHDLNNILAPILVSINLLQREWPDEKSQNRLEMIRRNVVRGSEMIKQVLTFARGSKGERVPLLPRPLLKEIVRLLQETLPRTITIESDIPDDLWLVMGDATQLHQLLMNLGVNARDAMPHGGRLSIVAENLHLDKAWAAMRPNAHPGPYLRLTVTDTGAGIPVEVRDKIFDPFFTTKEPGKGTGLGLSTVQGIVKGHDGFIEVESNVGQGTQFILYLPAMATDQSQPLVVSPTSFARQGNGELILVAEDEPPLREMLREVITDAGYRVLTACDGTEAVAFYSEHQCDIEVVLMDLNMPHLDGLSAFRVLRKLNSDVKVIATSGMASDSKIDSALQEHAVAFLPKPYTADKLLSLLADVLKPQVEQCALIDS